MRFEDFAQRQSPAVTVGDQPSSLPNVLKKLKQGKPQATGSLGGANTSKRKAWLERAAEEQAGRGQGKDY